MEDREMRALENTTYQPKPLGHGVWPGATRDARGGGRPAASSVIGPLAPKDPWAGHLSWLRNASH